MEDQIVYISSQDARFPQEKAVAARLQNADPPVTGFYCRGNVELLQAPMIAVVGSRRATPYGRACARTIAAGLARCDFTIVSGMAAGIDAEAHWAALNAHRPTVAVLGCGVDVCYPQSNRALYDRIAQEGLLISEYPPTTPPRAYRFPQRNRIIASLSHGVVVAQAAARSGSLITATCADDVSTPVFAVPGPIFEKAYEGTNQLICDHAIMVRGHEDICAQLGVHFDTQTETVFPDDAMNRVWRALSKTPQPIQTVQSKVALDHQIFLFALTRLELTGFVTRSADGGVMRA